MHQSNSVLQIYGYILFVRWSEHFKLDDVCCERSAGNSIARVAFHGIQRRSTISVAARSCTRAASATGGVTCRTLRHRTLRRSAPLGFARLSPKPSSAAPHGSTAPDSAAPSLAALGSAAPGSAAPCLTVSGSVAPGSAGPQLLVRQLLARQLFVRQLSCFASMLEVLGSTSYKFCNLLVQNLPEPTGL